MTPEFDIILRAVSQVGFPIAVAFWLLYRFEETITENTKAIRELRTEMARLREQQNE